MNFSSNFDAKVGKKSSFAENLWEISAKLRRDYSSWTGVKVQFLIISAELEIQTLTFKKVMCSLMNQIWRLEPLSYKIFKTPVLIIFCSPYLCYALVPLVVHSAVVPHIYDVDSTLNFPCKVESKCGLVLLIRVIKCQIMKSCWSSVLREKNFFFVRACTGEDPNLKYLLIIKVDVIHIQTFQVEPTPAIRDVSFIISSRLSASVRYSNSQHFRACAVGLISAFLPKRTENFYFQSWQFWVIL